MRMNALAKLQLSENLAKKAEHCRRIIQRFGGVVVAFSGGVDSSLVLALAVEVLGKDKVIAAMGVSTIFPQRDIKAGRNFAAELHVELAEISTPHLADAAFAANPTDRCYYCKNQLLEQLKGLASSRGLGGVVTGTCASDVKNYRPGLAAEEKARVGRPLLEAGISKNEVRQISRAMALPAADTPSLACLASRIPYGRPITPDKIKRVDAGEEFLRELGFSQCRLRDHDQIARIEVPPEEFSLALANREAIICVLKDLGYVYVTLDLQGFRSGSMNEAIDTKPKPAGQ
ncbi:MAG: ATP-dependent sacrificial sulfur transferase LarE [Planctomycetes bacterium]|nr:ATP-dependent sacrificial sulfur transferase LarE [Planctomycetota bacterium]